MDLAEPLAEVLGGAHALNVVVRPRVLRGGGRALGRHLRKALEPALVQADHRRPQQWLDELDAPALLGLLGPDEGSSVGSLQDPAVTRGRRAPWRPTRSSDPARTRP